MGKAFVVFIGIYFDNAKRDDQSKHFCAHARSLFIRVVILTKFDNIDL
jgi:hypothetical protein